MIKSAICATLIWFLASSAFATVGGVAGNGGDVVYCENGQPFHIELLDLYEAKLYDSGFQLDLIGEDLTEKLQYNISKISNVSPVRASDYQQMLANFFDEVFWVNDTELTDIPDSGHYALPEGCIIRQIAIQINEDQIPGKRYIVDQDLWNSLSEDQKVALMFHEIIYFEAIANGHNNSIATRKLNTWILSEQFNDVEKVEFDQYLVKVNFPTYELNPYFPELHFRSVYKENGQIIEGIISHLSPFAYAGQSLNLLPGARVGFYPDDPSKVEFVDLRVDTWEGEFDRQRVTRKYYQDNDKIQLFDQLIPVDDLCWGHHCERQTYGQLRLHFTRSGVVGTHSGLGTISPRVLRVDFAGYEILARMNCVRIDTDTASLGGLYYTSKPDWSSSSGEYVLVQITHALPQELSINGLSVFIEGSPIELRDNYIQSLIALEGSQFVFNDGTVTVPPGELWKAWLNEDGHLIHYDLADTDI